LGSGCDDFRLLPLGLAFFIIPRQTQHTIVATVSKQSYATWRQLIGGLMCPEVTPLNQLLDFLPILVFAVVYFTLGIYAATAALMVAVTLQILAFWLMKRRIGNELKLTFWVSMVFGGLTLWLQNETFIQWKPTVINWLLACVLLISKFFVKKDLLRKVMGQQLNLPEKAWVHLNCGWAAAFFLAGALNLVVAYNFSMDIWVSYKLIGGFGLTFCYIIVTMIYLHRGGYLKEVEPEEPTEPGADSNPGNDSP
jgi:intracellular septation protein